MADKLKYILNDYAQNYLFVDYNKWLKRWTLNLITQLIEIQQKSPNFLSQRLVKRDYKTLGTWIVPSLLKLDTLFEPTYIQIRDITIQRRKNIKYFVFQVFCDDTSYIHIFGCCLLVSFSYARIPGEKKKYFSKQLIVPIKNDVVQFK